MKKIFFSVIALTFLGMLKASEVTESSQQSYQSVCDEGFYKATGASTIPLSSFAATIAVDFENGVYLGNEQKVSKFLGTATNYADKDYTFSLADYQYLYIVANNNAGSGGLLAQFKNLQTNVISFANNINM